MPVLPLSPPKFSGYRSSLHGHGERNGFPDNAYDIFGSDIPIEIKRVIERGNNRLFYLGRPE